MRILYISSVCTPKVFDSIFNTSELKPGQAIQKFHSLLVLGLSMHSEYCTVDVLSSIPVSPSGHKKRWWNLSDDKWRGIRFQYIPFVNLPILKYVLVFVLTFFKVVFWRFYNHKKERIVICDILNVVIVWSTFLACKLTGQKIAVIVTDLPVFMVANSEKQSIIIKYYFKLYNFIMHHFDYYIGLTEQMDAVVNPNRKPFLVMEGLVDSEIRKEELNTRQKDPKKVLLYAGGIYEKYGVKNLIEAFMTLKTKDIELHIYGSGDLENEMPKYSQLDKRVVYFGVVNNSIVVERLEAAAILINPRPTTEEFTKFSFPSKNMEYMVSGTPLLTTKLPGMPSEYNDYVYLFEEESTAGIGNTLKYLLSKSNEELLNFGNQAQRFVLDNKSNKIQAKRIIDFLRKKQLN